MTTNHHIIPNREQIRILRTLDVDAAREWFSLAKTGGSNQVILASLHRARVGRQEDFSMFERALSKRWLKTHGYGVPETK